VRGQTAPQELIDFVRDLQV